MVGEITGRFVEIENKKYLYFYGTSYLALAYEPEFLDYVKYGLQKYGSSLGSSPMTKTGLDVYPQLESALANLYGYEEALLFASGFAAGQTVVKHFRNQNYKIYHGNIVHPALKLEDKIKGRTQDSANSPLLQVVDFIGPIFFEKYALNKTSKLNLIDASHGFGIFDEEIKQLGKDRKNIVCGSLNKGLGINAGVVLCSKQLKEQLMKSPRYATASPPSPAECYALQKALSTDLIDRQKTKLHSLLNELDGVANLSSIPHFPAYNLESSEVEPYNYLKRNDLLIWRGSYPSPDSRPVNRIVVNAAHKAEDLIKLKDCLQRGGF